MKAEYEELFIVKVRIWNSMTDRMVDADSIPALKWKLEK